jgi:hypothetical protein
MVSHMTSFHDTAIHFGLFANENKRHYALTEAAASFCSPHQLQFPFSHIILEGYPAQPIWNKFNCLAQDFIISLHSNAAIDHALESISDLIQDGGRSLKHYGLLEPLHRSSEVVIEQELYLQCAAQLLNDAVRSVDQMNTEQNTAFNTIISNTAHF